MTFETYSNFKNLKKADLYFQVRAYIRVSFDIELLKNMTKRELLNVALQSYNIENNVFGYKLQYD